MDRRTFVVAAATAASTALAGCTGGSAGGGGGDGDDEDGAEDTPTATTDAPATETATGDPSISNRSFERTGDASEQAESASVAFGEDRVTCTGVIRGKNGCMEASLESATYEAGTLRVRVTTTKEGGDVCTQQLVYRGYEAVVDFDGGLPNRVVVEHASMGETRTVTETTR
ncbi:hypothetical protein [Halobaculum limi]|uniref:hypothetical protein n=1 Tax=Halobaculum limi TaxID=3031916 RepID=UPI0024055364|nr:hypothetical protein [Halobaculum sp. YSMS11]